MLSKILNNQLLSSLARHQYINSSSIIITNRWFSQESLSTCSSSYGLSPELIRPLTTSRSWFHKTSPKSCDGAGKGEGVSGKSTVTYKPYKYPPEMDHDHKNMKLNRPMSPHLTIMAPALPAMTSIMQRITGTCLVFYTLMLAGGALFLPHGVESYVSFIQSLNLSRMSIFLIKLIAAFPFTYHYCIGIRFAMWNLVGKWLSLKEVYSTGYKAIGASIALAFLWALI